MACHVVEIEGNADCDGWSHCTYVYFSSSVEQGNLEYTITILNGDGEEVTSFGEELTINHNTGTAGVFEYCFEGEWDGEFEVTDPTVVISVIFDGQTPVVFDFDLDCTVNNEDTSWSSLKAMYR